VAGGRHKMCFVSADGPAVLVWCALCCSLCPLSLSFVPQSGKF
jgi:hypothetical protein